MPSMLKGPADLTHATRARGGAALLPFAHWTLQTSTIAAGYFLAALLTIILFQNVAVWPATGVAFAMAMLIGERASIGVLLGSVLSTATWQIFTGLPPLLPVNLTTNLGISLACALSTVVSARVLRYTLGGRDPFATPIDTMRFCVFGAGSFALVSALVTSAVNEIAPIPLGWFDWLASDWVGALVVAPVIVLGWHARPTFASRREAAEAIVVYALTLAVAAFLFGPWDRALGPVFQMEGLLLIPLFWAAVRLDQIVSAMLSTACLLIVWWGTNRGYGPFLESYGVADVSLTKTYAVVQAQLFMAVSGTMLLLVNAMHNARRRTEASVREEESKFRSLVEQEVAGIYIVRRDGTIAYINPHFARMLGYRVEEMIDRPLLTFVAEDAREEIVRRFQDRLSGRETSETYVSAFLRNDGRLVDVLIHGTLGTFKGQEAIVGLAVDMTERKKAERDLAFNVTVLRTQQETSLDGILVVDERGKIISYNNRFVEMSGASQQAMASRSDLELRRSVYDRFADPEGFFKHVDYLYEHRDQSSRFDIQYKDGHVFDCYSAPMFDGANYLGRIWFMRDITERKAAEAMRAQLAAIVASSREAIVGSTLSGVITSWNLGAETLYGYKAAEIIGKSIAILSPNEHSDEPLSLIEKIKQGEEVLRYETARQRKDGSAIEVAVTLSPILDADGVLCGISSVAKDITDRKRAERHIARVNRALKTLSAGNAALVHANDEQALIREMCRIVVEIGGYRLAWVGTAEHDDEKSVKPVAWAGVEEYFHAGPKVTWADTERGRGPTGLAIQTGVPQISQDYLTDAATEPWHEAALRLGFKSSVALPLKGKSGPFAALSIYSAEISAFQSDEIALLTELADDLAYGIVTLRTRTEHERNSERMQRSMEATIEALANTVEKRDPYTAGHQRRVAQLAVAVAHELKLADCEIEGLNLAAIVHDVGKINIPSEILSKSGRLTEIEYQMVRTHVQSGYDILKGVEFAWPIATMVLQHHERIDGTGYPNGITGDKMLLGSKILAVCDVVEAMMSHRPYRPARGLDAALAEIERGKGSAYDPAAVDACAKLLRSGAFVFK